MNKYLYLFYIISFFLSSCQNSDINADYIFKNANIWTGNLDKPNAKAMAIKGDSILAIGSFEDVTKFKSQITEVIDVDGNYITPGFIDCHVHLLMGGNSLLSVQLRDARTKDEFIAIVVDI